MKQRNNLCKNPSFALLAPVLLHKFLDGLRVVPFNENMMVAQGVLQEVAYGTVELDRYLSQLRLNGIFDRVKAVLFGQFTDCAPQADILKLIDQFTDVLPPLVGFGFPFGHDWPTTAVDQTRLMTIDADCVRILPKPAVI